MDGKNKRRKKMLELYANKLSKKEQIEVWLKEKEFARTSEVIAFGTSIYCNTADRICRQLGQEGKIRRLTDQEKRFRGYGETREDVWRLI
jgi:hypothetical protein